MNYLVSTSQHARAYHGPDRDVASRIYDRELFKPGVSSVVLFRQDENGLKIVRAAGAGVRIDTVARCSSCCRRTYVCRELCESLGYPVCNGTGGVVGWHAAVSMTPLPPGQ